MLIQDCGPVCADGFAAPCGRLLWCLCGLRADCEALRSDDRSQNQDFLVDTVPVLPALHSSKDPLCHGWPERAERSNYCGLPMCNGSALLGDAHTLLFNVCSESVQLGRLSISFCILVKPDTL